MPTTPDIKAFGGIYSFTWAEEQVSVVIDRLRESGGRLTGEIDVKTSLPGMAGNLQHADLHLASVSGKQAVVRALKQRLEGVDWFAIIEQCCLATIQLHRQGEPVVKVGALPAKGLSHLIDPLLQENQANVIFGPGGTGKSHIASLLGLMVQHGLNHINLAPKEANVLYLDYEGTQDVMNDRIQHLAEGFGIKAEILYRYSIQPLAYDLPEIQKAVLQNGIGLIIVDSVGLACGGEPEKAESVIRYFFALRALRVTSLSIDHVTKHGDTASPFGSVYKQNLARNVWEVRSTVGDENDELHIGLYHRKVNQGPLRPPIGIKLIFAQDAIIVDTVDVKSDAELVKGLALRSRIQQALTGGAMTVKDLSDFLEDKQDSIRGTLNRYRKKLFIRTGDKWGNVYVEK